MVIEYFGINGSADFDLRGLRIVLMPPNEEIESNIREFSKRYQLDVDLQRAVGAKLSHVYFKD